MKNIEKKLNDFELKKRYDQKFFRSFKFGKNTLKLNIFFEISCSNGLIFKLKIIGVKKYVIKESFTNKKIV